MKKNKIIIFIILFISIFFINSQKISASKATCTYHYSQISVDIIYTYQYGMKLKAETTNDNKYLASNPLSNNDFVNQETGQIFCPKLKISSTTIKKGQWEIKVSKNDSGITGELKILVSDDKEINSPSSNNKMCNYFINGDTHKPYGLLWNGSSVVVELGGDLEGYKVNVKNCDASDFANGCPKPYDQLVAKGKTIIIDCKNKIFSDSDQKNESDSSTNVDTGKTETNDKPNNDTTNKPSVNNPTKDYFAANRTCGGNDYFTFNKNIPRLTSLAYTLLKIAVPLILVIKGMMDMFKAMSAGKEDEMKKAQKKFIQRLIAGICAFLVFIIVETLINWLSSVTDHQGAMSCVNCFINGEEYCQVVNTNN